jgi:hypothetical protein
MMRRPVYHAIEICGLFREYSIGDQQRSIAEFAALD